MPRKQEMELSKDDKFWVTGAMTISIGAYETMKLEAGFSQTLLEGEDPIEMINKNSRILENTIIARMEKMRIVIKNNKEK